MLQTNSAASATHRCRLFVHTCLPATAQLPLAIECFRAGIEVENLLKGRHLSCQTVSSKGSLTPGASERYSSFLFICKSKDLFWITLTWSRKQCPHRHIPYNIRGRARLRHPFAFKRHLPGHLQWSTAIRIRKHCFMICLAHLHLPHRPVQVHGHA